MNDIYKLNRVRVQLVEDVPITSAKPIDNCIKAVEVVGKHLCRLDREAVCVINLNAKCEPINCSIVSIGSVSNSPAVPSDVLKSSILSNATAIILLHNHPSGNVFPSGEDIKTTDRVGKACKLLGLTLLDHIMVGNSSDSGCFSFEKNNMISDVEITLANTLDEVDFDAYVAESVEFFKKGDCYGTC